MKLLADQRTATVHHKYLVNGQPKNCAYCREPLQGEILRVGQNYFCNELCADSAPATKTRYAVQQ
jgi:hypothetical protein